MARKKHTAEEIITKLREADVLTGRGQSMAEACRQLSISEQTYYKWRKEYGGLQVDQAKRFKQLEQENSQLRKLVANLSIDNEILKEASRKNF
jgi:transposase-like protein